MGGRLRQNQIATTKQVQEIYQGGINTDGGAVSVKDCSDEGVQAIANTFLSWDADGDGVITADELQRILSVLNPKFTQQTVGRMMSEIDTDGSGTIDIHEFIAWLNGE